MDEDIHPQDNSRLCNCPIPEVVASAIAVLEQLSERARAHTGTSYIFQFNHPGTDFYQGISQDGVPTFSLGTYLRKFGYFVDVPELDDGTRWTFRPHQFRRFFAILYIWIYELGDWGALSYHLRHFNPEKTRRYASDDELGHIISIADREHTAQVIANAALGKSQVSGFEGNRLKEAAKRLHARMSQRIQVVPERKFNQRILRFVERADVSLHALPWGIVLPLQREHVPVYPNKILLLILIRQLYQPVKTVFSVLEPMHSYLILKGLSSSTETLHSPALTRNFP